MPGTVFGALAFNGGGYSISGNTIGLSGEVTDNAGSNQIGLNIRLTE